MYNYIHVCGFVYFLFSLWGVYQSELDVLLLMFLAPACCKTADESSHWKSPQPLLKGVATFFLWRSSTSTLFSLLCAWPSKTCLQTDSAHRHDSLALPEELYILYTKSKYMQSFNVTS